MAGGSLPKSPFLTYWDVADSEEADPCVSIDCPLLRFAVWLTAVVHEAGVVAFGPGVDDAVLRAAEEGGKRGDAGNVSSLALQLLFPTLPRIATHFQL